MNKLLTELNSICVLKSTLMQTERIVPNISDNDKTPSWDGELLIYSECTGEFTKHNILGKIPVQVKGTVSPDLTANSISYDVETTDLLNYKKIGGCIYFVVRMMDFTNYKIYYNSFLPYDLIKILSTVGQQKTKSIVFKELPADSDIIIALLRGFIVDQKKQISTADYTLNMGDLKKEQLQEIKGFEFSLQGTKVDPFASIFDIPTYIYAKTKLGASIPVQKLDAISEFSFGDITKSVIFNGKEYIMNVKSVNKKKAKGFIVGGCISIDFADNTNGNINLEESGNLSNRIEALRLWVDICEHPGRLLKIGTFLEGAANVSHDNEYIAEIRARLTLLESAKSALDWVGVKSDLDLDMISDKEDGYLLMLVKASNHEELTFADPNVPPVAKVTIANLTIAIRTTEKEQGKYIVENLFTSNDNDCTLHTDDGIESEASIYTVFKKDDFLSISNIDYDAMKNSITAKKLTLLYSSVITSFMLEALHAYDEVHNSELLDFIEEIASWIVENEENVTSILNLLQIVKRKRPLENHEITTLQKIKVSEENETLLLGTNILLESYLEAAQNWERLSGQEKTEFAKFPIFQLWKDHKPNNPCDNNAVTL